MLFDKNIAQQLHSLKIFLTHNSPPPTDTKYGWLNLPSEIKFSSPVRIEERAGLYGGTYGASVGAPNYHGFCSIGSFSYSASALPEGLVVGRYCSIATGLVFLDSHHPIDLLTTSAMTFRPHNHLWMDFVQAAGGKVAPGWDIHDNKKFPVIGNDVWIGRNVTLAMGITIGDGAIIAAYSVVTKDVPPYAIMAGNPAECKRMRFPNEIALRLLKSRWWDKLPEFVARIVTKPCAEAVQFIETHGQDVAPYAPNTMQIGGN